MKWNRIQHENQRCLLCRRCVWTIENFVRFVLAKKMFVCSNGQTMIPDLFSFYRIHHMVWFEFLFRLLVSCTEHIFYCDLPFLVRNKTWHFSSSPHPWSSSLNVTIIREIFQMSTPCLSIFDVMFCGKFFLQLIIVIKNDMMEENKKIFIT